ncbi:unnamed protein product [Prunus brigantina]
MGVMPGSPQDASRIPHLLSTVMCRRRRLSRTTRKFRHPLYMKGRNFYKNSSKNICLVDSATTHTIIRDRKHFSNLMLTKAKVTTISVYVDDMNLIGTPKELQKTAEYLKCEFEMKDLGKTKYYLGLQI